MFKLIIAILSFFGVYLLASMYWPALYNEAFKLGEYPIRGVEAVAALVVILIMWKS